MSNKLPPVAIVSSERHAQIAGNVGMLLNVLGVVSDKLNECCITESAASNEYPEQARNNLTKVHTAAADRLVGLLTDRQNFAIDFVAEEATRNLILETAEKARIDREQAQIRSTPFFLYGGVLVRVAGGFVAALPSGHVLGRGNSAEAAVRQFNEELVRQISAEQAAEEQQQISHGQATPAPESPETPGRKPQHRAKRGRKGPRNK